MTRQKSLMWKQMLNGILLVILLPLIPFLLLFVLLLITFILIYKYMLYALIWTIWLPRGKDILFVSSDSLIWHDYMKSQVLPLVQQRAVVLNWSERKTWPRWSLSVAVFRHFGQSHAYNP